MCLCKCHTENFTWYSQWAVGRTAVATPAMRGDEGPTAIRGQLWPSAVGSNEQSSQWHSILSRSPAAAELSSQHSAGYDSKPLPTASKILYPLNFSLFDGRLLHSITMCWRSYRPRILQASLHRLTNQRQFQWHSVKFFITRVSSFEELWTTLIFTGFVRRLYWWPYQGESNYRLGLTHVNDPLFNFDDPSGDCSRKWSTWE